MTEIRSSATYLRSIFMVGCLFFIFGFVTWLNGTLIPFLQTVCELNNFQAYLVTFAFYISYFVMALPSAWVLRKTGFKKGMSLGLAVMALGSLIFIPAANSRDYLLFLIGLFTQGLGLSVLQTATNPYVTFLGPPESAAQRISIMGIANKLAGILSPLLLAALLIQDIDAIGMQLDRALSEAERGQILQAMSQRIIMPYLVLAGSLILLSIWVYHSSLPDIDDPQTHGEEEPGAEAGSLPLWAHKNLVFGAIALFLYVGVEVIAADTIINYGLYLNIPASEAKFFTSLTLSGMVAGYLVGIMVTPRFLSQRQVLAISAILGLACCLGIEALEGKNSVYALAALGFANAMIWPTIWPLALDGLGRHTKTGSAILIMGIAGGAILPLVYGHLADLYHPKFAYVMLFPCYGFILLFSLWGSRLKPRPSALADHETRQR